LAILTFGLAVAPWPEKNESPTPRRARELHRPALKRPTVHAPPRLHHR
jgi:hypothetical protein